MERTSEKNGLYFATLFKFYRQRLIPRIVRPLPFNRIRAKTMYLAYEKTWNKIAEVCAKYGLDSDMYVKFLVFEKHCTETSAADMFFSRKTLMDLQEYLMRIEKRHDVFQHFQKSADAVADMCVQHGYGSARECLVNMIKDKTIGKNYVCGILSRYYLSAIPRFNTIIDKFDSFSRDDLMDIKINYDIYNTEINEAFLHYRHNKVNPFAFTDNLIFEKKRVGSVQPNLEK